MNNLWYKNPKILIENMSSILPNKKNSNNENSNSVARLSIYFMIGVLLLNLNPNLVVISLFLFYYSYKISKRDDKKEVDKTENKVIEKMSNTEKRRRMYFT